MIACTSKEVDLRSVRRQHFIFLLSHGPFPYFVEQIHFSHIHTIPLFRQRDDSIQYYIGTQIILLTICSCTPRLLSPLKLPYCLGCYTEELPYHLGDLCCT